MKLLFPYEIRNKVMDYFHQGYSTDEIVEEIRKEVRLYLRPNEGLRRFIDSIKPH